MSRNYQDNNLGESYKNENNSDKIMDEKDEKFDSEKNLSLSEIKQLFTTTHSLPMPTHIILYNYHNSETI